MIHIHCLLVQRTIRQQLEWQTVWGGYIGCTIWVPFVSNNPKHHNMILCFSHLKCTSTYLHGDCFVCTNFALCLKCRYHLMAPMMTSPVWFQIPKPKNKTARKKSNLPMAHYCMATPPDSGMAGGTLSLEIVQSLHTLKLSVKSGD